MATFFFRLWPGRRRVVLILLVMLAAAGAAGWWYRFTRPENRMQRGRAAIRRGDWNSAAQIANRLETAGQRDLACLLRGEYLVQQRRFEAALHPLERIQDEGSLGLQAAALVGRCLLELNNRPEAYRVFSFVLDQDPDQIDAHRGMAAIAWDMGNLTAALDHLDAWSRLDDSDGRSYRLRGLIFTYMGMEEEAETAYRAALERTLSNTFRRQVYLELAECLVRRTNYQAALEMLDQRKEAGAPEELATQSLRTACLWQQGKSAEARALADRTLKEYPPDALLLCFRGEIHLSDKEVAKAVQVLERAVQLAPCEHRCRYQLTLAYSAAGRKADAQVQKKRAEELWNTLERVADLSREAMKKPWDGEIRFRLAELCDKLGNQKLSAMWRQAAHAASRK